MQPCDESDYVRIRELFLYAEPDYSVDDAARLTGADEVEIRDALGDLAMLPQQVRPRNGRLPWDAVAMLALTRWTPRMIQATLGDGGRWAIPYLNRLIRIEVELPLYQVRILHYLAATSELPSRMPLSASDILEQHLQDVVSAHAAEFEHLIPGLLQALAYPYFAPQVHDEAQLCTYCGRLSPGSGLCPDCFVRHM